MWQHESERPSTATPPHAATITYVLHDKHGTRIAARASSVAAPLDAALDAALDDHDAVGALAGRAGPKYDAMERLGEGPAVGPDLDRLVGVAAAPFPLPFPLLALPKNDAMPPPPARLPLAAPADAAASAPVRRLRICTRVWLPVSTSRVVL